MIDIMRNEWYYEEWVTQSDAKRMQFRIYFSRLVLSDLQTREINIKNKNPTWAPNALNCDLKNVILPEIRVDRMTSELWAPRSFRLSYTGIEMLMF